MSSVGVPARFRSQDGEVFDYELIFDLRAGPTTQTQRFEQNSGGTPDDVACTMTHERVYVSSAADIRLEFEYRQWEDYKDQPQDEQQLNLMILVFYPADNTEPVPGSIRFRLQPEGEFLHDYHDVLQLGDTQYSNVLVDTHWQLDRPAPYGPPTDWPPEALIQKFTMAKGVGVLQIEYLNGDTYTREDALNGL